MGNLSLNADSEWNPDAFLFDFPDVPRYEGPLVDMPLIHKVDKIREYLTAVLKDSVQCLEIGAELPPLLAGLAAVDYVAGFYVGRQSKRQDYIEFMEAYFPPCYEPFISSIYDGLRCGLMHNLVGTNPWRGGRRSFLIVGRNANHLEMQDDRTVFSVLIFLEDVRRAWWKYAHELIMKPDTNPELGSRFTKRFDRLSGVGAFMVQKADGAET